VKNKTFQKFRAAKNLVINLVTNPVINLVINLVLPENACFGLI
jgi:hypothetical protein